MRVAFFAHFPFHRPILEPIHDALAERAECLLSSDRHRIVGADPHVVVMTAHAHLEYFRRRLPRAITVNVRHGMIGKRIKITTPGDWQLARALDAIFSVRSTPENHSIDSASAPPAS